jgi:hypothetical protein
MDFILEIDADSKYLFTLHRWVDDKTTARVIAEDNVDKFLAELKNFLVTEVNSDEELKVTFDLWNGKHNLQGSYHTRLCRKFYEQYTDQFESCGGDDKFVYFHHTLLDNNVKAWLDDADITHIEVYDESQTVSVVAITTTRPGMLIGKRGTNFDALEKFLGVKIKIYEERDPLLSWLIPYEDNPLDFPPYRPFELSDRYDDLGDNEDPFYIPGEDPEDIRERFEDDFGKTQDDLDDQR